MKHLDRLQAILIQLQSKRIIRAQEIAERFNISLRTVYRDIRSLEESGVPIGAEAGVGYFLMDNYSLPPVCFSKDEAGSLIFAEKLIQGLSDGKVNKDFTSAILKIKALLRPSEKDELEKLNQSITVLNHYQNTTPDQRQLFLYEIQQAILQHKAIKLSYRARYNEQDSERIVEPIGLCNYYSNWHLYAWCRLRQQYRDFRLDRISSLQLLTEKFNHLEHKSLENLLKDLTNTQNVQTNISFIIDKSRKPYLDTSRYWYGFLSEEEIDENSYRMRFQNDELHGFAAWLLNAGVMVKVEYPSELLDIIRNYLKKASENYL